MYDKNLKNTKMASDLENFHTITQPYMGHMHGGRGLKKSSKMPYVISEHSLTMVEWYSFAPAMQCDSQRLSKEFKRLMTQNLKIVNSVMSPFFFFFLLLHFFIRERKAFFRTFLTPSSCKAV